MMEMIESAITLGVTGRASVEPTALNRVESTHAAGSHNISREPGARTAKLAVSEEQASGGAVEHGGLYFSHPACLEHDPRSYMPEHPDTPERLLAIEQALSVPGWLGWERRVAPPAQESHLQLVHDRALIERLKEMSLAGGGAIDSDTFVGEPSYRAALHAAGGACEMTKTLLEHEADVGFCGVRPSGHHAEASRAMGFCLFNNVAIAAEYAICELGVRRVFILDWDVHHGNGTAEIFRRRPDVLFASIHQGGIYPGHGRARRRRARARARATRSTYLSPPARRRAVAVVARAHRAPGRRDVRTGARAGISRV